MTVDDDVRDLKARVEQAQRARARAEMERDAAQAALTQAQERLAEFGVNDAEGAQDLLLKLESQLGVEVGKVRVALAQASGRDVAT